MVGPHTVISYTHLPALCTVSLTKQRNRTFCLPCSIDGGSGGGAVTEHLTIVGASGRKTKEIEQRSWEEELCIQEETKLEI